MSAAPQPLLLDTDARRLFAVFHPAAAGTRAGVVVCPPFLHEHALSYRLFALLGDALAAQGIAVLRFDYHGTGDSAGDDTAFSLDGARADAALALDALRAHIGAAPAIALGARGGAFAAAALAEKDLRGLWLWEPIVDGAAYLQELRDLDRAERTSATRYPNGGGERVSPGDETLIGFACSATLLEQLNGARLEPRNGWPPVTLLERAARTTPIDTARRIELAPGLGEWADRVDIDHFPLPAVRELATRLATSPELA